MDNLNNQQEAQLSDLLLSRTHSTEDMMETLKLYILVRKGRLIDINLTRHINRTHPAYNIVLMSQTQLLNDAYNQAMQWFGLNYRK
jgi:hypothetical protein